MAFQVMPYNYATVITPSDTVNFAPVGTRLFVDALQIGTGGTCSVVLENNEVVAFTLISGQVLPIKCKRVNASGTAALLIRGLYYI